MIFKDKSQFHYLADIVSGEFGTGQGDEILGLIPTEYGTYTPIWVPLDELMDRDVRPRVVAELMLKSRDDGWPKKSLKIEE